MISEYKSGYNNGFNDGDSIGKYSAAKEILEYIDMLISLNGLSNETIRYLKFAREHCKNIKDVAEEKINEHNKMG